MAHVEVTKLSNQELAELACTYAALILHDDGQDITGTYSSIQAIRSESSWLPLELRSRLTGPSCSPRLFPEKTSPAFLTSAEQLLAHQLLGHPPPVRLPPPLLKRKMIREAKNQRLRKKPLPLPLRRKKRTWIWATSLADTQEEPNQ